MLSRAHEPGFQRKPGQHHAPQLVQRAEPLLAGPKIKGMLIKRLRVQLRRFSGKKCCRRMGKKPAFAGLVLFFPHHAHGHFTQIGMNRGFPQHGFPPFSLHLSIITGPRAVSRFFPQPIHRNGGENPLIPGRSPSLCRPLRFRRRSSPADLRGSRRADRAIRRRRGCPAAGAAGAPRSG